MAKIDAGLFPRAMYCLAKECGVKVLSSFLITKADLQQEKKIISYGDQLGYPLFVKPLCAGYTEKYTLKSSQIHVLARSSQQKAEKFGKQERLINSGFYDLATVYQSVHVNY